MGKRHSVAFYVVVYLILYAVSTFTQEWATPVQTAASGVVRIEMMAPDDERPGVCAGAVFVKEYLVSAAHCFDQKDVHITVNGRNAGVARINRIQDLAVVRFEPKEEQPIPLAASSPAIGAAIAVLGFPFGSKAMQIQAGHISSIYQEQDKTRLIAADVIGGDSGGPVINAKGELIGLTVGIYYSGPMHLGAIVPVEAVREFVTPYLPKPLK